MWNFCEEENADDKCEIAGLTVNTEDVHTICLKCKNNHLPIPWMRRDSQGNDLHYSVLDISTPNYQV